jgi:hypothetical protein
MTAVRHLIVEGSSSSVDNGGAGTISYHTLYLPNAIQETDQQCFATDGAGLSDMIARQSLVIAAFRDGPNILFVQAGQNDLVSIDAAAWLAEFSAYLATFREAIQASGKLVRLGVLTIPAMMSPSTPTGRLPTQPFGFFQVMERATSLLNGPLIQYGVLILRLQTRLYILTERIHRRRDRTIWRRNIFVLYLTLLPSRWPNCPFEL